MIRSFPRKRESRVKCAGPSMSVWIPAFAGMSGTTGWIAGCAQSAYVSEGRDRYIRPRHHDPLIPAKAGIQDQMRRSEHVALDPRFRGDERNYWLGFRLRAVSNVQETNNRRDA